jgi:hypothetical protein
VSPIGAAIGSFVEPNRTMVESAFAFDSKYGRAVRSAKESTRMQTHPLPRRSALIALLAASLAACSSVDASNTNGRGIAFFEPGTSSDAGEEDAAQQVDAGPSGERHDLGKSPASQAAR